MQITAKIGFSFFDLWPRDLWQSEKSMIIILIAIIGFAIVVDNRLVIAAYKWSNKIRQSHFNLYIVNLATADFFIGFISAPLHIYSLISVDEIGLLSPELYLQSFSGIFLFVSVLLQIAMSYDLYLLVTDALKHRRLSSKRKLGRRHIFMGLLCSGVAFDKCVVSARWHCTCWLFQATVTYNSWISIFSCQLFTSPRCVSFVKYRYFHQIENKIQNVSAEDTNPNDLTT